MTQEIIYSLTNQNNKKNRGNQYKEDILPSLILLPIAIGLALHLSRFRMQSVYIK